MRSRVQVHSWFVVPALLASALVALHVCRAARVGASEAVAAATQELHRALGLLQYVYGDYEVAVDDDGMILNEAEFLEQHRILDEVAEILEQADQASVPARSSSVATLGRILATARDAAALREPPAVVRTAVRELRDAIVAAYALRLAPQRAPRLERGGALYQQSCSACHGSDGRARTALSLRLRPPPTDLREKRLSETLSPYQVFNVVTFGIPGTAMPSFETLDVDERWDLAFHVVSMRHDVPGGQAEPPQATSAVAQLPSLSELAGFTDAELGDWFVARGVSVDDKNAAVARARRSSIH